VLLNVTIFSDLEWPLTTPNHLIFHILYCPSFIFSCWMEIETSYLASTLIVAIASPQIANHLCKRRDPVRIYGNISETVLDRAVLVQTTNKKWCMAYQIQAVPVTLSHVQCYSLLQAFQFCSSWQAFNWHSASHSPSTVAELLDFKTVLSFGLTSLPELDSGWPPKLNLWQIIRIAVVGWSFLHVVKKTVRAQTGTLRLKLKTYLFG